MRFLVYLSLSITLAAIISPSSQGQLSMVKNFRINRGGSNNSAQQNSQNSGKYKYLKPLQGAIEHREENDVDANDYADPPSSYGGPLDANIDSSSSRLHTGARDHGGLRSGINDQNTPIMRSRIQDNRAPMVPGFPGMDQMPPQRAQRLPGDVNDNELKILKSRDLVIMQDRSSSMGEREHFPDGKFPRWYWCLSQAQDLRRQTTRIPDWSFNLVMFSSQFDVYRNVRMDMLPTVFERNHIFIGTRLASPVADQVNEYFQRRPSNKPARPLVIAIVTDGKPQDEHDLADVIINTTHQMRNPNEVRIVFLQVGTDEESYKKLSKLDNRLMSHGARYDIVSVMQFQELTRLGLTRALIRVAQSPQF